MRYPKLRSIIRKETLKTLNEITKFDKRLKTWDISDLVSTLPSGKFSNSDARKIKKKIQDAIRRSGRSSSSKGVKLEDVWSHLDEETKKILRTHLRNFE